MLDRAGKAGQAPSLLQARDYCGEALRWPVEDGIAANVEVQTEWLSRDALGVAVTVTKPDKATERFDYAWAWTG
jgi:phage gp46-like protein